MSSFTPLSALVGGLMIGLGSSWLLLSLGRIAGISGIVAAIPFSQQIELAWRAVFLLGLISGVALMYQFGGVFGVRAPVSRPHFPAWALIISGLLVGYGTAMGNGCTSGHGVCGVARRSPRSLIATLIFLLAGLFSASVLRHLIGA